MTFDSTALTNVFLACIALTNLVILAILYEDAAEKSGEVRGTGGSGEE